MYERPIYANVASTAYSGTTLLAMLMNSHPQIISIGELANSIGKLFKKGNIDKYYCSCGREIEKCEFWEAVKHRCLEKNVVLNLHDFDLKLDVGLGRPFNRILFGIHHRFVPIQKFRDFILWNIPLYRKMTKRLLERNSVIAKEILDITGNSIFLDTSKDLKRANFLAQNKEFDFKLIHLVRDFRGFFNSYIKHNGEASVQKVARRWKRMNMAAVTRFKTNLPRDSYLLVRYESICHNPKETLKEICRFLGAEELDLTEYVSKQEHHIIGNNMRRKTFNGIRVDESWKKNLSASQIAECLKITDELDKVFPNGS